MNKDYKSINNLWKDSEGYRYFGTLKLSSKIKYDGDDFIPLWEWINQLQQENKILKENAENNDKVVDKVNWKNMLLKKENKQLKAQIEEYQQELEKADSIIQSCIFNGKEESKISYRKCLNMLDKKETQQKEFIKYLENRLDICDGFLDTIKSDLQEIPYGVISANENITTRIKENEIAHKVYEEILQKYKSIIGVSDENNMEKSK